MFQDMNKDEMKMLMKTIWLMLGIVTGMAYLIPAIKTFLIPFGILSLGVLVVIRLYRSYNTNRILNAEDLWKMKYELMMIFVLILLWVLPQSIIVFISGFSFGQALNIDLKEKVF